MQNGRGLFRKRIQIGASVAAAVLLLILFINAGRFLIDADVPRKADVIIVFAGDRGARTEEGVRLYKEGYAPMLMMSGGDIYHGVNIAEAMKTHALELGVPENAILLEPLADSTQQNAVLTLPIINEINAKKVLVVTSEFHTRRTKWILDQIYKLEGIDFRVVASQSPGFNPEHWWSNNKSIMVVVNEYVKLVGYWLGKGY